MEWFKEELKRDISRGDRSFAMSAVIGALESSIRLRDMKLADEILDIMYEVGLFKEENKWKAKH